MCCEADWKREVVPDHKFDFINVREFHKTDFWTRFKYVLRYVFLLKSFAVYGLDIFSAVTMISSTHWTNAITSKCDDSDDCPVEVQFSIAKWVFVGCIIFSFLLLGYESYKAKKVVDSRDISYAFTNLLANDYYCFKNYDNFCLFCQIESSTKKKDDFAFFIFFAFKNWKRLLLADGPRQSINGILLYAFASANDFQTSDIPAYWDGSAVTALLLFSMIFTVLIFAGSLLMLIFAAVAYVPLLCYIQGNLKEYVCHKVDKRITDLIKKKQKHRIARAAAIEKARGGAGGGSAKESMGGLPQPTLPQVSLDDDEGDTASRARSKAERAGLHVPNAFDPSANASYGSYDVYEPSGAYAEDYGSSANLAAHAAPLGISYPPAAVAGAPSLPPSYSTGALPNPYSPAQQGAFPASRSNGSLQDYTTGGGQPSGRVSPYAQSGRLSPSPYGQNGRMSPSPYGQNGRMSPSPYGAQNGRVSPKPYGAEQGYSHVKRESAGTGGTYGGYQQGYQTAQTQRQGGQQGYYNGSGGGGGAGAGYGYDHRQQQQQWR
ncbi:hypothetical protein I350_03335 [Cryptococcus amylolentus CBS 6273]|uniref:Vacuolar protein n=1 Tax=Cryptococcus amylolentus CBS 6273 TaxID=1296118 RepID=A0A1E3K5G0_9TREE|nr:hypothetical protein I350_03335 [Cryptococcus amylolentus CBS 6273]